MHVPSSCDRVCADTPGHALLHAQLVLVATHVLRTQTHTREEEVAPAEAREPWALPSSIFRPRLKEADARAFLDHTTVGGCVVGSSGAGFGAHIYICPANNRPVNGQWFKSVKPPTLCWSRCLLS
jgi:hypothetical protein